VSVRDISAVLVANRGEIARRVLRTCHSMGLRTVAIHSDSDRDAPFVAEADAVVALRGASAAQPYLDAERIIDAARRSGARAVHPGYGFLSEDPAFAQACVDAGLTWVGPPPSVMRAMAHKVEAKRIAADAGVPVLPSKVLTSADDDDAVRGAAQSVGYPLLVKASAGGGGKGIRPVATPDTLLDAVRAGTAEAASAFGDGTVMLERHLAAPRHVEVQLIGDIYGTLVHLLDRDCSLQRRHQKVVEEAPAPFLSGDLRSALHDAAVGLGRTIGYTSAGTVEFLVEDDQFWFLEMNTRLQVEHPVTEEILGVDLVRAQLEIAAGRPLTVRKEDVVARGHAVEARLYAEDPRAGFLPTTGRVLCWGHPSEPGLRYEDGVTAGSVVGLEYDPMLAKVVATAGTREEAVARLAIALRRSTIHGLPTNRAFLVAALEDPDFVAGRVDTSFIERHPHLLHGGVDDRTRRAHVLAAAFVTVRDAVPGRFIAIAPPGWRDGAEWARTTTVVDDLGEDHAVTHRFEGANTAVLWAGGKQATARLTADGLDVAIEVDGIEVRCSVHRHGDSLWVDSGEGGSKLSPMVRHPNARRREAEGGAVAPMPGTIVSVHVRAGDTVAEGQVLVVMEAMKMLHTITAPAAAAIAEVRVEVGDVVDAHAVVVVLHAPETGGQSPQDAMDAPDGASASGADDLP